MRLGEGLCGMWQLAVHQQAAEKALEKARA